MPINFDHFTEDELHQLAQIRENLKHERPLQRIQKMHEENILLRRLLLEAITSIIHHRKPNDEFMKSVDQILRLDKFR